MDVSILSVLQHQDVIRSAVGYYKEGNDFLYHESGSLKAYVVYEICFLLQFGEDNSYLIPLYLITPSSQFQIMTWMYVWITEHPR